MYVRRSKEAAAQTKHVFDNLGAAAEIPEQGKFGTLIRTLPEIELFGVDYSCTGMPGHLFPKSCRKQVVSSQAAARQCPHSPGSR